MTDIESTADALNQAQCDERRALARRRLADARARVSAEGRAESREQVRELMGWA